MKNNLKSDENKKYNLIDRIDLNRRKISLNFCLYKFSTILIFLQNQLIKRQRAKNHNKTICFYNCIVFV